MDPRSDSTYNNLFDNFTRAFQGYKNAVENRRRALNYLAVKRSPLLKTLNQYNRRPVGSPLDYRIPGNTSFPSPRAVQRPKERLIYLGHILGYAKIIYATSITPAPEPDLSAELDKLYDRTSLNLYWNAKIHFEKSKKALLDYSHRNKVRDAASNAANLQLLGVENDDSLAAARREVDAGCVKTWNSYQASQKPKSSAVVSLLLESLADANFVGLESPTAKAISQEVNRLIMSNALKTER